MNTVYNIVPSNSKRLERCGTGWVIRYGFEPTEQEGKSKCIEKSVMMSRKPKFELVQRLVSEAGFTFSESDYNTDRSQN